GGCFWRPSESVIVRADDPTNDWGMLGEWEGSVTFYHGASGDQILIHPGGDVGKWSHEIGWESSDQPSVERLGTSFHELIEHFPDYLSLPLMSPRRRDSPFCY